MGQDFGSDPAQQEQQPQKEQKPQGIEFEVDGRKYTPEDAAKKIKHADEFIETLKREKQEQDQKLKSLEEKLSMLLEKAELPEKPVVSKETGGLEQTSNDLSALESKLAKQVEDILNKKEQEAAKQRLLEERKQIFNSVNEKLIAAYGEDAKTQVQAKAQELGISYQKAVEMASDPEEHKVFLKLFVPESSKEQAAPSKAASSIAEQKKSEPDFINMTSSQIRQLLSQNS